MHHSKAEAFHTHDPRLRVDDRGRLFRVLSQVVRVSWRAGGAGERTAPGKRPREPHGWSDRCPDDIAIDAALRAQFLLG